MDANGCDAHRLQIKIHECFVLDICQWRHKRMVFEDHSIGSSFPRKLLHNGQLWCASRAMFRQHGIKQQKIPSFPTAASFNAPLADCCARLYFTDVVTFCLQLGQMISVGSMETRAIKSWKPTAAYAKSGEFSVLAQFEDSPWPNCRRPRWTIVLEDCVNCDEVWAVRGICANCDDWINKTRLIK